MGARSARGWTEEIGRDDDKRPDEIHRRADGCNAHRPPSRAHDRTAAVEQRTMMRVRRAGERHRLHSGGQNMWLTFYPELPTRPLAQGFGALSALNEGLLPPEGTMLAYSRRGTEVITYVIDGTLSHRDGCSRSHLLRAGDFQRSGVDTSDHVSYSNASGRSDLHVMQLSLLASPRQQRERAPEQKSFAAAPNDREGGLRLIGSADGRFGSLLLDQDVQIYSGVFAADRALRYPLLDGRMVWLQIVSGDMLLGDLALARGDGVGVTSACDLLLLAQSPAEFVLLDLSEPPRRHWRPGNPAGYFYGIEQCVDSNRQQPCNAHPGEWTLNG